MKEIAIGGHDLTRRECEFLRVLASRDDWPSQGAVGEAMGVTKQYTSNLIKSLTKKGAIRKSRSGFQILVDEEAYAA